MIPNKLYIPTTTLNFNNIMSSESISPASFYARRQFGYKRFEKVEPNSLDNRIILYDKYPEFDINDKELDNYPMIIEIDTKFLNEDVVQENNGRFFADETIYLNPFTTKIYFCNEQEKVSTLSKAKSSIETKMDALYNNCLAIKPKGIGSFKWNKLEIEDSKIDNSQFISKDRKINKLKGFLYAYILAANKSLSKEVVTLKKYAKELGNTLSAIINSSDGKATSKQEEQLKSLYNAINDAFYKAAKLDKQVEDINRSINNEYFKEGKFEEFLVQFGTEWLEKLYPKPLFQLSPFLYKTEKEKALDDYISTLEIQIDNYVNISAIPKEKFPVLLNFKIEKVYKDFLPKLLNEYLAEAYNWEDFLQSRYDFAISGGKIFKEKIEETPTEKWEGSPSQKYINNLFKNLNESSAFNIKDTLNPTLKSFAAFCQKGDTDIDKLEDYLISNEISDFRIAFALWGIVFGFANMPKTLTDDLFLSDDLDYVSEVYKYIFKQVHGIELEGKLVAKKQEENIIVPSKMNEQQTKTPLQNNNPDYELIINTINSQQRENKFTKYKPILLKLAQESKSKNDFLKRIETNREINKNTSLYKTIKKLLGDNNYDTSKSTAKEQVIPFESSNPPGREFYNDRNIWYHIENLLPDNKKIRKQVKEDLDWFQDEYQKGNSSQYYGNAKRENSAVIDSFKRYIEKKKYANSLDIERIISKLKELSLHNEQ